MCFLYCRESKDMKFLIVVAVATKVTRSVTQKLIWNKICKRDDLCLYTKMGYRVDLRCLSCEFSMLIGSQLDSGMAIMWGMRSQVFCFFDVAATNRRCWFCCNLCWIPLKSMDRLKIDSCSKF